jgi:hypothetical protein
VTPARVRPPDLTPALRSALGGVFAVTLVALGIVTLQLLVPADRSSPAVVDGKPSTFTLPPPTTTAPAPVSPTTPPSATPSATVAARLALTVLNNSKVNGLAKKAAADFTAKGWTVAGTGNLPGRLATTTVYYPAGMLAAAVELRRQFPAITDSAPRYAGLPGDGTLTVVVTRDYPH